MYWHTDSSGTNIFVLMLHIYVTLEAYSITEINWTYIGLLTHWGRVTHICVSKLSIIGSDNGLSRGRRQAIIWTNAGILLIRTLGRNFIQENALENVVCEMASVLSQLQWVNNYICINYYMKYTYFSSMPSEKYMLQSFIPLLILHTFWGKLTICLKLSVKE